jgi:hypothetical protein
VGSNPIVSTAKVLVTALRLDRKLRRTGRRAQFVPTNGGVGRVIVGMGGHGRLLAEALELDDIDWRVGEFTVRGKARRVDRLPLVTDVGETLAGWLQRRPATESRAGVPDRPRRRSGASARRW